MGAPRVPACVCRSRAGRAGACYPIDPPTPRVAPFATPESALPLSLGRAQETAMAREALKAALAALEDDED